MKLFVFTVAFTPEYADNAPGGADSPQGFGYTVVTPTADLAIKLAKELLTRSAFKAHINLESTPFNLTHLQRHDEINGVFEPDFKLEFPTRNLNPCTEV
jgi:hypothetical protein